MNVELVEKSMAGLAKTKSASAVFRICRKDSLELQCISGRLTGYLFPCYSIAWDRLQNHYIFSAEVFSFSCITVCIV